jgi:hypothetical protein
MMNTSQHKQQTFLYEYPLHWAPLPMKNAQQNTALQWYTLKNVAILTTETSLWTCVSAA